MPLLLVISIGVHVAAACWATYWCIQMRSRVMMLAASVCLLAVLAPIGHVGHEDHVIAAIDLAHSLLLLLLISSTRYAMASAEHRLDALRIQAYATRERQEYTHHLHSVIVELITRGDLTDMPFADAAAIVVERARSALDSSRASVWLLEEDGAVLRCVSLFDGERSAGLRLQAADYPRYFSAIASGRAVDATDAQTDPRTSEFTDGYLIELDVQSMLDAAIRVSGRVAGVICIEHCGERRAWTTEEMEFVGEIGDLLGGLLAHATAVSARNALIQGLARLADYRDTDGTHLERVAEYSRLIAVTAEPEFDEIDDAWIRTLTIASAVHDIGKVGIPDEILLKPGALTPEERVTMQHHSTIGADAIIAVQRNFSDDPMIRMSLQIALQHHERWDGKGYPASAHGDDICLSARIVSIADVYDALTSRRVYHEAMSHEQACATIRAGAGFRFDPRLVEAFMSVQQEINEARLRLQPRMLQESDAA